MSALISEQTTTWSIPDQFQENEDVKALLNIWRTTQGGAIIKAFAENRPPPEDDMVTHVGGDCEMGDG
jgi:hypothetical protein